MPRYSLFRKLFNPAAAPTLITEQIELNGVQYAFNIYIEKRNNSRAAVVKTGVNIRIPASLSAALRKQQIDTFREWGIKTLTKRSRNVGLQYENGTVFRVGQREYNLVLVQEDRKNFIARMSAGNNIIIAMPESATLDKAQKPVKTLLSRIVADDHHDFITLKLNALNARFFQQKIKNIRLRYNHSNWGSCASNGNISISTRLLFAPDDVIDYVCIHELAHLIEPNHSHRFWALVRAAMPDYKEKERWLRQHGPECHF